MSPVPARTLEAVRALLTQHADELRLDPASVKALASHAVTARQRDGGLLRLDVSTYTAQEVSL